MNILNDYDLTVLQLAELEGERWLDEQLYANAALRGHTCSAAVATIRRVREKYRGEPDLLDPREVVACIYGAGGWNRFFVRLNGDVELSWHHRDHTISREKVESLGIRIFN
jgi:hypothetical protein